MKISAIKQQVKQKDRYSIYIDNKYAFSLSERALLNAGLASGQELSSEQLNDYKQLSADDKVYSRILRYAAMRPRTEWEIKTYMERKDAALPLIEQTIDKLKSLGLIDDYKYAAMFIRDRRLLRSSSRLKLTAELKKRRVPTEAIEMALSNDESSDKQALAALIIRKRKQSKYQDDTKLMQFLARQGFGYGDIKQALKPSDDFIQD